jgi:hypothetical protein
MTQPPYQPPPNVTINQRSSCGPILIVLLILGVIGTIVAVLLMGGCLAMFA